MKRLIAEFEKQSFTQIIFPHPKTDWIPYLKEAEQNFINIINNIIKYQKCLVICADIKYVKSKFSSNKKLFFIEYLSDDTWARDCSAISLEEDKDIKLLDFIFTGWGSKFKASKDNAMNKNLKQYYLKEVLHMDFILEGGAIESNGCGLLLTTSTCMLNKNRNNLKKDEITKRLKEYFGVKEILYLEHGYLAGDDTDSHIDTLARFIDEKTIMYIKCEDKKDEHYEELKLMEDELKSFAKNFTLHLISLPLPDAIYYENERLPATYANFLFINDAVLVPLYNVPQDKEALKIFKKTFPKREIVGIDCQTLIKQHGSLHCVTMNFANGIDILDFSYTFKGQ